MNLLEPIIAIRRLPHGEGLSLPAYATPGSVGLDLAAAVAGEIVLEPGERVLIPTGLTMALPAGFEAQVRPRSGLALKHGVTVLNAPGTVDADYRGEVSVLLVNFGRERFAVHRGDRVAQMIVAPVARASLTEVANLPPSERGAGGYGSTGVGSPGSEA
jgi:dUTP pyrophosphatase